MLSIEKMVVVSSTTNEWPQNHIDEKDSMMTSMEKPNHEQQQQQQQQALKCPRCDSSNTKFCYYNNYSLSQPRHFCKACKRYWTRGGTLRNVPVGGGCRKNKRVKRPTPSSSSSTVDGVSPIHPNPPSQPPITNVSSTPANHLSPLFYGLANNNLPFGTRYDLNGLGIGYSCSDVGTGFSVNPNTLLSSYSNIFRSSSCTTTAALTATAATTTPPTIASLLASTLHQHKFGGSVKNSQLPPNHFQNMATFQDVEVNENGLMMKDIKLEGQNRMEWNVACQNQMEQIGLSDPTVYWNPSGGAWHDPGNMGSSVTSLI